jgi:tetratricopeptide (TPR) repeat protein
MSKTVLLKLARGLIKLVTAKPETGSSDRGQRASESTPSPKTTASRKTRQRRATSVAKQPTQTATDSYNRGLRYLADENYDEALDALDQAIELDATLALAHYNRGLTHYLMRNEDLAIEDFDRALELGFGDAILFRQRANAFSRKGDVARAVADYAQAIALEPQDPLVYFNRGEVYENTLQKKLAIADYKTVLNLECDPQLKETARTRLRAMGVKLVASDAALALGIWQKKLAFLQAEEARAADADQKFSIQQRIEEAKAKIQELGG